MRIDPTTPKDRIAQMRFLEEMRQSKLCWSPFGYGELCWRDIEAYMTGAVLIKPDVSHLGSLPDLYRPHETYLPVRWDFPTSRMSCEMRWPILKTCAGSP